MIFNIIPLRSHCFTILRTKLHVLVCYISSAMCLLIYVYVCMIYAYMIYVIYDIYMLIYVYV